MNRPLVMFTLLLLSVTPVLAQKPATGPPPTDRRINTDRVRQQDMSRREWQLRNFGTDPGAPKDERQLKVLMAQMEEDFNRILTVHNEIARALKSDKALDYKFVSEATSEINKRASRVQSNLRLSLSTEDAAGAEKPKVFADTEIKDALITLCIQIRSFVTNPVIDNPNLIDVKEASRARRDLGSLIQLSAEIRRDAEKLSKN